MTAAAIKPSDARKQHNRIERVVGRELIDTSGQVAAPYRVVDTLELMFRNGSITYAMLDAGERFRELFEIAQLDVLKASNMERAGGGGVGDTPISLRIESARRKVWEMVQDAGGITSPGGAALWHVVGLGESLTKWGSGRRLWASGCLAAALGMLVRK